MCWLRQFFIWKSGMEVSELFAGLNDLSYTELSRLQCLSETCQVATLKHQISSRYCAKVGTARCWWNWWILDRAPLGSTITVTRLHCEQPTPFHSFHHYPAYVLLVSGGAQWVIAPASFRLFRLKKNKGGKENRNKGVGEERSHGSDRPI